jgi:hypothetical protein
MLFNPPELPEKLDCGYANTDTTIKTITKTMIFIYLDFLNLLQRGIAIFHNPMLFDDIFGK